MRKLLLLLVAAFCMQFADAQKPNSKFGGVQVGAITYSYRTMSDQSLGAVLNYIVQSGLNSVELLGGTVEQFAGIPRERDAIRPWRTSVSMDKFKEVKKMFDKQGVKIHLVNFGYSRTLSDGEIDYFFNVCKALGAKGIVAEVGEEAAQRLAPFADKHKLYVVMHNHGQPGTPDFSFDKLLAFGPRLMLNLDVGHYYASTGKNPCDEIRRLNKRIFSLHLKDRTWVGDYNKADNLPFGKGQTPLVEVLQLIQKEKYPIFCDIELEYAIPAGSDDVKEVIKCVDYCRKALIK